VGIRVVAAVLLLLASVPAVAEAPADTLAKARETGKFVIGYREDARPFSFKDEGGNPAGFSVDLCRQIAKAVTAAVDGGKVEVTYALVPATKRIEMVERGAIDIECGSSTHTIERRERVDFTLATFVDGAEMLIKKTSGIADLADVAGKKVGVLGGTTTETGLRAGLKASSIPAEVVTFANHDAGLKAIEDGTIAAYFADRTLLLGLASKAKDPAALQLSGRYYSYEPYGLMLRKGDHGLRLIADRTLAEIYRSGEIWKIFRTWFGEGKPSELLVSLYILNALPPK
jgi:polar amino acid transport system substrate-binding protein/glutamate/aspartate transport system substrate-binding protein